MTPPEDKTAIVTGGSRGFGLAVVEALVGDRWRVVTDARSTNDLARALDGMGDSVLAVPGSVTDPGHVETIVREATAGSQLSMLVNNASFLGPSPQPTLAEYPLPALREVYEVNVLGPLRLVQLALPHLRASGGTIVNVTSDAAVEGYETWGGYGSSKAALEQISNVLSAEEPDVTVYWFDPGDMRTQMHQEAFPGEDISDRPLPETRVPALMRLLAERPPSGRYTAEELLTVDLS